MMTASLYINYNQFIMRLSIMNNIQENINRKGRISLALGLTDESFAVNSLNIEKTDHKKGYVFFITVMLTAYITWVISSFVGGVLGDIIPEQLSQSMGIALYALFIGLLVPSIKKNIRVVFVVIVEI